MKGLQISNSGFLCCFVFQAVCISGDTQYVLLTGKSSEGSVNDRWQITAETQPPHMSEISSSSFYFPICGSLCTLLTFPLIVEQNLKSILIGEKSGSNISMSPLLFFSGGTRTDTRSARLSFCWHSLSSETRSALFFCLLSQMYFGLTPGISANFLPLWDETLPGWCSASGTLRIPSTSSGLLTVSASPLAWLILQRDPAGSNDQLHSSHSLWLHELELCVAGVPRRAGPVCCTVRGAQTETGPDFGANDRYNQRGRGFTGSQGEPGEAQRTERVTEERTCHRWHVQEQL